MNILITGIAGFIGSHLASALLADGHEVSGIDDLSTGRIENLPYKRLAKESHGDIRAGIPEGPWDVIYHAAASYKDRDDWERDAETNVLGTVNVVREAQRSGARLIYFQTSLCYGLHPASPVRIDSPLDPHGSYAVTKTAGEAFIRDSGVDYVSLRLANIYGPRNLSGPIPTFYQRLAEGRPVTVVDTRRDYVFVDDLVAVAVKALTTGSGAYHVASGQDYSILELYQAVCRAMGMHLPDPPITPRGDDDAPTLLLDPFRTQETFDWRAAAPLDEGIGRAVEWYQARGVTETFTHLAMKG